MNHLVKYLKLFICVVIFFLSVDLKGQSVYDQFDTIYNAGISARTLPGYSWYQTFTAGLSGSLSRIDIGFCSQISGSATIEIYEDSGLAGNMIFTGPINVNCPLGNYVLSFSVNCNIVAGNIYSFHFIPGIGIPDPYCVQADITNSYSGGELYSVGGGGSGPFNMDLVFATYVKPISSSVIDVIPNIDNVYHLFLNSVVLAENATGELFSSSGKQVEMSNLAPGIYILRLIYSNSCYRYKIFIN